jgi:hypothetical protein
MYGSVSGSEIPQADSARGCPLSLLFPPQICVRSTPHSRHDGNGLEHLRLVHTNGPEHLQ